MSDDDYSYSDMAEAIERERLEAELTALKAEYKALKSKYDSLYEEHLHVNDLLVNKLIQADKAVSDLAKVYAMLVDDGKSLVENGEEIIAKYGMEIEGRARVHAGLALQGIVSLKHLQDLGERLGIDMSDQGDDNEGKRSNE